MITPELGSASGLYHSIDSLLKEPKVVLIVQRIANVLHLDYSVLNRYFGNSISNSYDHKKGNFELSVSIWGILISLGKVSLLFILIPILSMRFRQSRKVKKHQVLIEGIQTKLELKRWAALKKELDNDVVFLSKFEDVSLDGFEVVSWKQLYRYQIDRYFLIALQAYFVAFVPLLILTLKHKINFFDLLLRALNDFIYYTNVFAKVKGKYLVQDRNLGSTNAIKNFLFKKSGGIACCCVQKNIWQSSGTALYSDIDIFFAIGRRTGDLVLPFGSRLEKIHAVGSMSMQNAILYRESAKSKCQTLDVLFVGSNTSTDLRRDWSANYEAIAWLVQFAKEFPQMKVGIKHHQYSVPDLNEGKITKGSRVIYIDPDINSYTQALESRIVVSYASTLVYEMIGIGKEAYFLDPKGENTFINSFVSNDYIVKDFEKLKDCLIGCDLDGAKHVSYGEGADYCIPSLGVVRDISAVINPE